jgi:multiple sugar transport system substrate-binding protein
MTTPGAARDCSRRDGATAPLRGLTWDHPRGYLVLDALAATAGPGDPAAQIRWDRQPLEDFESRPLRTLADDYDLLVIDHPGLGEAVRDGCLRPLDDLFSPGELAGWRDRTVGASFDSYRLGGQQWALPLDAAAQVSVCRPETLGPETLGPETLGPETLGPETLRPETLRPETLDERPASWADAIKAAGAQPTALCLGGPHALLMFAAICVASGRRPAATPGEFVPTGAGRAALGIMAGLLAHADREVSQRNPIGVLDAMTAPGGPSYCPLVYGYVTYHRPERGPQRLTAFDAPAGPGGIGSVLGGTGIAVTRSAAQTTAQAAVVAGLLRTLLSEPVQVGLYAELGGQSSLRPAWQDSGADERSGGFYRATRRTVESAWVRPRFAGYPAFQAAASAVLRDGLLAGEDHASMLGRVNELFARSWETGGRERAG